MKSLTIAAYIFILVFCASCLANNYDGSEKIETALSSLEKIFPNALSKINSKKYDFCPDSTCIEIISQKSAVAPGLVLVYLYYEGDYYDLDKWRQLSGVKENIVTILDAHKLSHCLKEYDVDHICLKNEFKFIKIKINNIRYDEDKRYVKSVW